jgi:hypothetical protein
MNTRIDIARIRANLDDKRLVGFDTPSEGMSKSSKPLVGKLRGAPSKPEIVKSGRALVGKQPSS